MLVWIALTTYSQRIIEGETAMGKVLATLLIGLMLTISGGGMVVRDRLRMVLLRMTEATTRLHYGCCSRLLNKEM